MPNLLQNSPFSHFKFSSLNFYNISWRCTSPDYAYTVCVQSSLDFGGETNIWFKFQIRFYGKLLTHYNRSTMQISKYCCAFESHSWWGVLDVTICDKVCQWLAVGRWFSPGTDRHDITEIMLKVAMNTITIPLISKNMLNTLNRYVPKKLNEINIGHKILNVSI